MWQLWQPGHLRTLRPPRPSLAPVFAVFDISAAVGQRSGSSRHGKYTSGMKRYGYPLGVGGGEAPLKKVSSTFLGPAAYG